MHGIQKGTVVDALVSGNIYFAFYTICQRLGASVLNVYREARRQVGSRLFQSRVQDIYKLPLYTRLALLFRRCRYE